MSCCDDLRDLKEFVVKKGDLKPEDLQHLEPGTVVIFPSPKWTHDKPTKPGWYWYRDQPHEPPQIVKVFNERVLEIHDDEDPPLLGDQVGLIDFNGEWCGPLQPPQGSKWIV